MRGPDLILPAGNRTLALGERPRLMGILNATPDSFSGDSVRLATLEARVARAHELVEEGAEVIDVGGESQITTTPPVAVEEEIERVAPLIDRIAAELDVLVSVDTYKPAVAEAAVAAGAGMVNDVSGLLDPPPAARRGWSCPRARSPSGRSSTTPMWTSGPTCLPSCANASRSRATAAWPRSS